VIALRIYEQAVVKREAGSFKGMFPSIYSASTAIVPYVLIRCRPHSARRGPFGLSAAPGVRPFIPLQNL